MPYQKVDKIAKLIPFQLKMTVDKAMRDVKELRELYEADPGD